MLAVPSDEPSKSFSSRFTLRRFNSNLNRTTACKDGLCFSGKFAGGIISDIRRRLPWYKSDWVDGVRGGSKTITAALYMFCGCLAPGIAFGAYFDEHTGGKSGVVEYLITQGVSGVIFAIFSGQPLIILRPTGPITVFISQLYTITKSMDVEYLSVQAWVGIFVGTYMVIIAVTDSCAIISYCSRFTQDLFGFFVSVIFISMGVTNIVEKFTDKQDVYHPHMQFIITVATLYTSFVLAGFNRSRFANSKVRELVSDFAVAVSIVAFTIFANLVTLKLEPLPVPKEFGPTSPSRSWFVDLGDPTAVGIGAVAAIPLVLLFFIDQNVTSLLTQHPDHNLRKGAAFHLNFLILGLLNMCLPLFGCPYVTGSLPHSPQFVNAMAQKEIVRDGRHEQVHIIQVYENRIAPLLVNLLILACLPVIGELDKVPTAVICDALFLFMGFSGMHGNQLFERIKLVFTEESLYPPMHFTKEDVPRKQMHVFTLLQFAAVCILFGVTKSPIAVAFPVFLVLTIPFRMAIPWITCGFITEDMVGVLDHTRKPRSRKKTSEEALRDSAKLPDCTSGSVAKAVIVPDDAAESRDAGAARQEAAGFDIPQKQDSEDNQEWV